MSDKLKIMQAPLTRNAARMCGEVFAIFHFATIAGKNYYVEVPLHEGVAGAIVRLRDVFGVDANSFCADSVCPVVKTIEVVAEETVPAIDCEMNYVALLFPRGA